VASLPRATPKSHPPQLKADARRAESRGRTARAIALLEEVLRQTPEDWSVVQRLADLRARAGDRRRAVELYRRLAEHDEEDGHLPRAIAAWRIVLRHDPEFVGAHVKLGELYERQGFRAESRRQYEAAAAGFERQGRPREAALARQALEPARDEAPEPPGASGPAYGGEAGLPPHEQEELVAERLVEARMYRRYDLPTQARAALETILGIVPDHAEARAELAELQGDGPETVGTDDGDGTPLPDAVADLGEGRRGAESVEDRDLESLEFTLVVDQDPEELVLPDLFADLEDVVAAPVPVEAQLGCQDDASRYDLGIAYREMGLIDEAIAELQLASRSPARLVDCASLLASCFLEKGLPALAVRWLERGLAAGPAGDEARRALQYELGHALEAAGELDRALEVFTELYGEAAGYREVVAGVERLRRRLGQTNGDGDVTRGE
jgi:tetratricopeptide (TPR) repeat protein